MLPCRQEPKCDSQNSPGKARHNGTTCYPSARQVDMAHWQAWLPSLASSKSAWDPVSKPEG